MNRRRRILSLAIVAILAAAIFGACGSGKMSKSEDAAAPSSGSGAMPAESKAPNAAAKPTAPGQPGGSTPTELPTDRKIILNASFDMRVKDVDEGITKVDAAVRQAGGYVQESRVSRTKVEGRIVNMTLRVPSGHYGSIKDLVRSLGDVAGQREWTEDVTAQFVDLEERIKTKEIHLSQLQKLYAKGGSIKEMMELEQEINRVTADLESMKGQMRVLSNRIDFSTITVNLFEPGAPAPIQPPKSAWERMTRGFKDSFNGVINFCVDAVVLLVSSSPVLVFLAILGGVMFFIIRGFVRWDAKRRKNLPPAYQPMYPMPPSMQQQAPQQTPPDQDK